MSENQNIPVFNLKGLPKLFFSDYSNK